MDSRTETLVLTPGIYTEGSDKVAQNRWRRGNRVRFSYGYAETIGGWVREQIDPIPGITRSLRDWNRLDGVNMLAAGSTEGVFVFTPSVQSNITPVAGESDGFTGSPGTTPTAALTDPFTTVSGDATVTVAHVAHGLAVGTLVSFEGATAVGGLDLNGDHTVATVPTLDTYTIEAASAATGSATGGGTVEWQYRLNLGRPTTVPGSGFGIGPYGDEAYGTPRTVSGPVTGVQSRARVWRLDNWGQDLIVNPRGGGVYLWPSTQLPVTPARRVSGSPYEALGVIMSPQDRTLIAYGCTPEVSGPTDPLDPLVIRWCSKNDYTQWTTAVTNTAGELRIEQGTEILQAVRVGANILFLTEQSAHRMFPVSSARVYGLLGVGEVGAVSPQGGIGFRNHAYWMSPENFVRFGGAVEEIPCDVHSAVFEDFNYAQRDLVIAGVNRRKNEVWWHYPSKDSDEIDRYCVYDVLQQLWHIGELDRTAWYGSSVRYQNPLAVAANGTVYVHEQGTTADGAPLGEWIESYDMYIPGTTKQQGAPVMRVNSVQPDFGRLDETVRMTLQFRKWPGRGRAAVKAVQVAQSTLEAKEGLVHRRARGRYLSLKIDSGNFRGAWSLGSTALNVQSDGER